MWHSLGVLSVLSAAAAAPGHAQDPALVEALAPIMMLEDRRELNPAVLAQSLEHPEAQVRRAATVAIGRIGQRDGVPFLIQRLQDRDPGVVTDAFFAMGLLKDPRAVTPMLARLRSGDTLETAALGEAAIALARIGGSEAIAALTSIIGGGGGDIARERREHMLLPAMLESWRLGKDAPVTALLPHARDEDTDRRWRALYVLGRIRAPAAGDVMLDGLRDRVPLIRETAARSLTKAFADTAGLSASTVLGELGRAADDQDPGVRINALGAIGTYRDTAQAGRVAPLLNDPDRNVRVAAANALAMLRGGEAVAALEAVFTMRDPGWALERAALGALAQADTAAFHRHAGRWLQSADPLSRANALQLLAGTQPAEGGVFQAAMADRDPRVRSAALAGWSSAGPTHREAAAAAARDAVRDPDPLVRRAAIAALDPASTPSDIDLMVERWRGGDTDLREAILAKLGALARTQPELLGALGTPDRRILMERPADPSLRTAARRSFPALAARWGATTAVETGRTLEDYRGIVRGLVLAPQSPRVTIEVEGRGDIEVELLAREAPLTVANFLQLVDRRYFDGNRWHRVVPNFVIQDGDRTGLGSGGPGWTIRDEINRRQYDIPMLGMALSGPDTGGSQWFINLSPQPHLNGQYTIFGRVMGSYNPLKRVTQGDVIRTIRR
jgi:cyclophilin family peptidyl-prolyl cis-trans isomerase/HEAT repeat protein